MCEFETWSKALVIVVFLWNSSYWLLFLLLFFSLCRISQSGYFSKAQTRVLWAAEWHKKSVCARGVIKSLGAEFKERPRARRRESERCDSGNPQTSNKEENIQCSWRDTVWFLTAQCEKRCDLKLAAAQTTCSTSRQLNEKVSLLVSSRRVLTSAERRAFLALCDWGTVFSVWVHWFLATEVVLVSRPMIWRYLSLRFLMPPHAGGAVILNAFQNTFNV